MNDVTGNVDSAEQEKFDRIAASWWDPDGESRPLHDLNPARLAYISERVELNGLKVVDVGCGGGILSESMAAQGAIVTGIDIASKALAVARLHLHESGCQVDYQNVTAESWAEKNMGEASVVTCMEMLEHVPDPASVIQACSKLAKPGGLVFFSTLNKSIKSYLLAIVAAEKLLKLVPDGTHDHDKFIRPSQLISWAESSELKCIDASGIHYNPITENHTLNDALDVNYILCCRKL